METPLLSQTWISDIPSTETCPRPNRCSPTLIPPLHERPAVVQQVQVDQFLLEIVARGVVEAGAYFREQVVDVFAARALEGLADGAGGEAAYSVTLIRELAASWADGRSG